MNFNSFAKSSFFSKNLPKSMGSVAPFVWGSPDDEAPEYLRFVKSKFAKVPLAPFVWGFARFPKNLICELLSAHDMIMY